ncbi:MAG: S8 family serine peptidase [Candidatus Eisenbacteria bacterium]|uniref:S8 family serine peptidase n=1 Tax=Eiseniibacteriota bacterium TaxID=2212470 RepID=A0A849SNV4_UNCEI|nr:S8 family serine peptidase [Candidatus Eisenbacteria bacterium]
MWMALGVCLLEALEPRPSVSVRIIVAPLVSAHSTWTSKLDALGLRRLSRLPITAPSGWLHRIPGELLLFEASDTLRARLALDALRDSPEIAWAEPETERTTCDAWMTPPVSAPAQAPPPPTLPPQFPNDPLFRDGRQWGLRNAGTPYAGRAGADVRALEAWSVSRGRDAVILGVVDTGIDPTQPELGGQLADGSPRIRSAFNTADPRESVHDSIGHGTLVAGVMAARTGNGTMFDSLGVAGVCGGDGSGNAGCRIVPVRVTHGGLRTAGTFAIANGILHAAGAGARAINLSFAGSSPSRAERLALATAIARSSIVVAASGNDGYTAGSAARWPAAHAAEGLCIQVGASDSFDERANFSSFGPGLDLLAPGVEVWGTSMTYRGSTGYQFPGCVAAAGTSFAAPFVTGAIGLVAALRDDLLPDDHGPLLRAAARDIGPAGFDATSGAGVLDLERTLQLAARDRAVWHAELAPSVSLAARDSLRVGEPGIAILDSLGGQARVEWWFARAPFTLPDSLADSTLDAPALAWARASRSRTIRDDRTPPWLSTWAQVTRSGPRRYEATGWLARVVDPRAERLDPALSRWIPCPPESARIAVTALAARRMATNGPAPAPASTPAFAVSPNPFRGELSLSGRPGDRLAILDLAGRRVARITLDARGRGQWNGQNEARRRVPPGLYFARRIDGREVVRLVRLD